LSAGDTFGIDDRFSFPPSAPRWNGMDAFRMSPASPRGWSRPNWKNVRGIPGGQAHAYWVTGAKALPQPHRLSPYLSPGTTTGTSGWFTPCIRAYKVRRVVTGRS